MRFTLVGCGAWGKNYLKTVKTIPGIEISNVIKRSILSEDARTLMSKYGLTISTPDALDYINPTGVIIATPPQTHKDMVIPLLQRKIPVLLEKPVAHTYGDAKEIFEAAKATGTLLLVNNIHLFADAFLSLKDSLVHRPIHIVSCGGNQGPFRDYSSLLDYAPHDLAMCLSLFDGQNPDQVEINKINRPRGETYTIALKFGDSSAELVVGNGMTGKRRYFEVTQGRNKIVYDDLAYSKLIVNGIGTMKTQEPPLTRVIQTFAKSIIDNNRDWRFDYELNLRIMKIIQQGL